MTNFDAWQCWSGNRFIYWCNTEPRMCLAEAELVKEFLSAKYVQISGKSWLQRQNSKHFIGRGLLMANGYEWYHQRQIVAPAFTPDRIKVQFFTFDPILYKSILSCMFDSIL